MSKICLMCGETFPDSTTFCAKDGSALRAAVHGDDLIGEVFCDRYVVTDLLGEGGMGSVYVARDVRLPQQVAIKVLRDKSAADPTTVSRFKQEAEAASRINHDRVARVSDFGFMHDGRAYIIMEYVSGRTLKQTIDDRGPLAPTEAAKITSMVAEGLDAAHRIGIVHRDLKPENVMIVDDAGGGMRVKVLDFGIAKLLQGEESTGKTAPGFVIGTPQWMSPEQILGETLDARSDVFALGLLAFSMLTAQRAFHGGSEQAEMMARLSSAPTPLVDALPGVVFPVGLQELLNRTLSRDVSMRPIGALAFARELSKIVETNAATATQTSTMYQRDSAQPDVTKTTTTSGNNIAVASGNTAKRVAIGTGAVLVAALVTVVVMRQSRSGTANGDAIPTTITSPVGTDSARLAPAPSASIPAAPTVRNDSAATKLPVNASQSQTQSPSGKSTSPVAAGTPGVPTARPNANDRASLAVTNSPGQTANRVDGSRPPAVSPSPSGAVAAGSAATTTAHDELQRLMDEADADIGSHDNNALRAKARETLRKLDEIGPRLTDAIDQGWLHEQTGEAHATLGDNDKACAEFVRAHALTTKSGALRSSVEKWQQTLNCAK